MIVKLELENKNSPRKIQPTPNQNFNHQYRRPPLQLLQRERKYQQDLYLEYDSEENVEETIEIQENWFSSLSDEEHEIESHKEEEDNLHAPLDDGEIDEYLR